MTNQGQGPGANTGREMANQLLSEGIKDARKQEILESYEQLLRTVLDRLVPSLGRVTVIAITERALALTQERFPAIERPKLSPDGLFFDELRDSMGDSEVAVIRAALHELVADVIDIIAILTGDDLMKHLIEEIEVRRGP
jgi:hypothetical protein